jgi:hypothetical protein
MDSVPGRYVERVIKAMISPFKHFTAYYPELKRTPLVKGKVYYTTTSGHPF